MPARLALASLPGGAQVPEPPLPAAVQWTAPQECPDAAVVRAKISRRLGRALAGGEAAPVPGRDPPGDAPSCEDMSPRPRRAPPGRGDGSAAGAETRG